jgi:hypothetical protein
MGLYNYDKRAFTIETGILIEVFEQKTFWPKYLVLETR